MCGLDKDPKAVKRWLSNTRNSWLLIIDNADDSSINVSEFFPAGNQGSILLTTRNPQCKIHSTVGSCEFGQMRIDEAVTLFLRVAGMKNANEAVQEQALLIVRTLGFLALAIVQAGAYIRQGFYSVEDCSDMYNSHRRQMLKYLPVQTTDAYTGNVYTTWEVSIEAILKMGDKTSHNAIELIRMVSYLHYDGITEDIFEQAWSNSYKREGLSKELAHMSELYPEQKGEDWNPKKIREAVILLASFSLIKVNGSGRYFSIHPLVHVWARHRLSDELQRRSWITASSTLADTMPCTH